MLFRLLATACLVYVVSLIVLQGPVVVQGEVCTLTDECINTTCCVTGANTQPAALVCIHPNADDIVTNGGECTCLHRMCSSQADCISHSYNHWTCPHSDRHCVNSNCTCSAFPPGRI